MTLAILDRIPCMCMVNNRSRSDNSIVEITFASPNINVVIRYKECLLPVVLTTLDVCSWMIIVFAMSNNH